MLWAVRIRWLGYDNKWHRHTTRWHENSGDAWEEAEAFENSIQYHECSSGLTHKMKKQEGGVKMPFLARGVTVFGRKNRFKTHLFTDREKAHRFWLKCKRLGLDAQLVY